MITATSEDFWSGMIVISLEAPFSQARSPLAFAPGRLCATLDQ